MTAYTTLATLKASLGISDSNDDTALQNAINAASQAIDDYTETTFAVTTATTRLFRTDSIYTVWVDQFTDLTTLVVKTGNDGTFPVTLASTDVVAWPYNAEVKGQAYQRLDIISGSIAVSPLRPTVQVTAKWGWTTTPTPVSEACLIKAARLFRRKDSPEGVAGTSDFGVIRISKYEDPDVAMLLSPYCMQSFA